MTDTMPGEFPTVQYKVLDPTNGDAPYDLMTDPVWTDGRRRQPPGDRPGLGYHRLHQYR